MCFSSCEAGACTAEALRAQRDDFLTENHRLKGGGFGLRLKAGSVRRAADEARNHVTLKLSSGSGGIWFLMYSIHISSVTLPLVATQ